MSDAYLCKCLQRKAELRQELDLERYETDPEDEAKNDVLSAPALDADQQTFVAPDWTATVTTVPVKMNSSRWVCVCISACACTENHQMDAYHQLVHPHVLALADCNHAATYLDGDCKQMLYGTFTSCNGWSAASRAG